jgi:hypothetical protein
MNLETARYILGIAGSIAGAIGAGRYIWSIWRGNAEPEFWTWLIFAVGLTGAAVYTVEGHPGLSGSIFPVTLAALIDIIFVHTWFKRFRYKEGSDEGEKLVGPVHKFGLAPLAVVLYGLLVGLQWPALVGVLIGIAVDFSALSILLVKSWRKPNTEDWPAYFAGAIGGVLGLLALQKWNFTTAAFPVYFAVTQAAIVFILLRKRFGLGPIHKAAGAS